MTHSASSATEPLLSIQNLRVVFPGVDDDFVAVEDLSFDIAPGETLAIVGESGSGKSVTAKSIMRLVGFMNGEIRNGSILFHPPGTDPCDLVRLTEEQLRGLRGKAMALVFQEPMTSLNPVLTVAEQIVEVILLHESMSRRAAMDRALEALRQVRIPEAERRLRQYPHELAGGMRQRVMIAMALACKPALLIADEPTTALDVTIQAEILGLLKTLQQEIGMAVLFITHDMGVVAEIADRVIVMRHGRKVEDGPVHQIFHEPRHTYTRALLSAVPRLGSMKGKPRPQRFEGVQSLEHDHAQRAEPAGRISGPHDPAYADSPILEVMDLTVRFPVRKGLMRRVVANVHAVENVSFRLYPGETLSIVGESGSGKSTTGRAILRLVEATSGDIILRGRNITNHTPAVMRDARRHIQMVFQDPFASLNPRMTVEDLVGEPFRIHENLDAAQIRHRVVALLERVGLGAQHLARYPFEFSGGQRQRICIARALALNPSIIIADEAVSALDVSIRAQVVNLMMDLQQELGLAYLFISHDIAVVERISHRIAVMYLGEIVEMGTREDILGNPRHPYTQRLISAVPVADPDCRVARTLEGGDIPSAVHPRGFEPVLRPLQEVTPGHYVLPH